MTAPTVRPARPVARAVLRSDGCFEFVLAALCLWLAARPPRSGGWALPEWAGAPLMVGVAGVLVLVGVALLVLAGRVEPATLRAVSMGNGATAVALFALAGLDIGAGPLLRLGLAVAGVVVGALALTQAKLAAAEQG